MIADDRCFKVISLANGYWMKSINLNDLFHVQSMHYNKIIDCIFIMDENGLYNIIKLN